MRSEKDFAAEVFRRRDLLKERRRNRQKLAAAVFPVMLAVSVSVLYPMGNSRSKKPEEPSYTAGTGSVEAVVTDGTVTHIFPDPPTKGENPVLPPGAPGDVTSIAGISDRYTLIESGDREGYTLLNSDVAGLAEFVGEHGTSAAAAERVPARYYTLVKNGDEEISFTDDGLFRFEDGWLRFGDELETEFLEIIRSVVGDVIPTLGFPDGTECSVDVKEYTDLRKYALEAATTGTGAHVTAEPEEMWTFVFFHRTVGYHEIDFTADGLIRDTGGAWVRMDEEHTARLMELTQDVLTKWNGGS